MSDREPIGQAINSIIRTMDVIIKMAVTPNTYDEVVAEEEALWVIKGRAEWLLSYIAEKQKASRIRLVK